jgi:hypothetical protein
METSATGQVRKIVNGPEAEPIDLLAVVGVGARLRSTVPYLVAFAAGAVIGALITRWLS